MYHEKTVKVVKASGSRSDVDVFQVFLITGDWSKTDKLGWESGDKHMENGRLGYRKHTL